MSEIKVETHSYLARGGETLIELPNKALVDTVNVYIEGIRQAKDLNYGIVHDKNNHVVGITFLPSVLKKEEVVLIDYISI